MTKKIIMFYGQECSHCQIMHPIVEELTTQGYQIDQLEVWHDQNNANKMREFLEIISKASGGELVVPTFLDQAGQRAICGARSAEDLKQWIDQE